MLSWQAGDISNTQMEKLRVAKQKAEIRSADRAILDQPAAERIRREADLTEEQCEEALTAIEQALLTALVEAAEDGLPSYWIGNWERGIAWRCRKTGPTVRFGDRTYRVRVVLE